MPLCLRARVLDFCPPPSEPGDINRHSHPPTAEIFCKQKKKSERCQKLDQDFTCTNLSGLMPPAPSGVGVCCHSALAWGRSVARPRLATARDEHPPLQWEVTKRWPASDMLPCKEPSKIGFSTASTASRVRKPLMTALGKEAHCLVVRGRGNRAGASSAAPFEAVPCWPLKSGRVQRDLHTLTRSCAHASAM